MVTVRLLLSLSTAPSRTDGCTRGANSVALAVAQLHEDAVRRARMDPGDVVARAVDRHAVTAQLRHRARNVRALEADEIHALPAPGQKPAHGLIRIRRLHELDV